MEIMMKVLPVLDQNFQDGMYRREERNREEPTSGGAFIPLDFRTNMRGWDEYNEHSVVGTVPMQYITQ